MATTDRVLYLIAGVGAALVAKGMKDHYDAEKRAATKTKAKDPTQDLFSHVINNRTPGITVANGTNPFPPEELARKKAMEREGLPYLPRINDENFPSK